MTTICIHRTAMQPLCTLLWLDGLVDVPTNSNFPAEGERWGREIVRLFDLRRRTLSLNSPTYAGVSLSGSGNISKLSSFRLRSRPKWRKNDYSNLGNHITALQCQSKRTSPGTGIGHTITT